MNYAIGDVYILLEDLNMCVEGLYLNFEQDGEPEC